MQWYNSAITLQNGFATHFQASPLISMRAESLASSQSCRSVDADAWCKRALIHQVSSVIMGVVQEGPLDMHGIDIFHINHIEIEELLW